MAVYLDRFLNVPKQPIPVARGIAVEPAELLAEFDRQQRVDETAQLVAGMLAEGRQEEVISLMGHALLREEAGIHMFQLYEAAVRKYGNFAGRPGADHILVGDARLSTAQSPTVRARGQTFDGVLDSVRLGDEVPLRYSHSAERRVAVAMPDELLVGRTTGVGRQRRS